jgi:hypothetical protein
MTSTAGTVKAQQKMKLRSAFSEIKLTHVVYPYQRGAGLTMPYRGLLRNFPTRADKVIASNRWSAC